MQVEKKNLILCPLCGSRFTPQFGNICEACTLASVENQNILSASDEVVYCRFCERYERPPWINCERESQQMMGLLLKKVRGLNKVTFKNAKFVWTEPHSKRFKLKIEIQRDISDKLKVEQTEIVEFVQRYGQCPDCKKQFTPHDWNTAIQVRQNVAHKRTFLTLEQNLLKQKFASKVIKVQQTDNGVDFFFKSQNDSIKLLDYIKGNLPIQLTTSKQLISQNMRDNTSHVKTTHSVKIPKICRDDLVKIPPKMCKEYGNCSPILLCLKVTKSIYLIDISSFRKIVMSSTQYFMYEDLMQIFTPKLFAKEYTVLDNEGVRNEDTSHLYRTYGVSLMKDWKEIFVRTHLENLDADTEVMGYDLTETEDMQAKNTPDVVLFKKIKNKEVVKKEKKPKKKTAREQIVEDKDRKNKEMLQKTSQKLKSQTPKQTSPVKQDREEDQWSDVSDDSELGDGEFDIINPAEEEEQK